jgi:hypothetical protein
MLDGIDDDTASDEEADLVEYNKVRVLHEPSSPPTLSLLLDGGINNKTLLFVLDAAGKEWDCFDEAVKEKAWTNNEGVIIDDDVVVDIMNTIIHNTDLNLMSHVEDDTDGDNGGDNGGDNDGDDIDILL